MTKTKKSPKPSDALKQEYKELVHKYYSGTVLKEWKRLEADAYRRLEFDTTAYYLGKYLPQRGLVLDAGGGPGRYAIHLAKAGYDAVLFDFTPELLEKAKREIRRAKITNKIHRIIHGTICDLSMFKDGEFDAVLCLGGALSHVIDRQERGKALDELIRVAKKGAPIFVSVIGQLALLVTELVRFPNEIEMDLFQRIKETGDYYGGYGFAPCHFYKPQEIREEFESRGLKVLEMAGLEGLSSGHPKETNRLHRKYPEAWKIWWETHLKTCIEPTSVGISEHFLIVCRK